ncbi:hypothetical protein HK405_001961, partial [Cladochytrium tenue]
MADVFNNDGGADAFMLLAFRAGIANATDATLELTADDVTTLKNLADSSDSLVLWKLFSFLRQTLVLLGGNVDLVLEQVVPLFDYNVGKEVTSASQQIATTTTEETVLVSQPPLQTDWEIVDASELVSVGGIVVTLTKQTLNAETNEVIDSTDYTLEIPGYALNGWWTRLITFITLKFSQFDIAFFLKYLSEGHSLDGDASIISAFHSAGAAITEEDLASMKDIVMFSTISLKLRETLLLKLLLFIRYAITLVGVDLVTEQVLPLFDYSATAEESVTVESETVTAD